MLEARWTDKLMCCYGWLDSPWPRVPSYLGAAASTESLRKPACCPKHVYQKSAHSNGVSSVLATFVGKSNFFQLRPWGCRGARASRSVVTPWTGAHQAPLSVGFSRQEYWSGLPCPSPGDLPDPGIKPQSPAFQADSLRFEPQRRWSGPSPQLLLSQNAERI